MKTAMQELIEKIELNDYWIPNHIKNELLEKEKEQIMQAFQVGIDEDNNFYVAEEYYNKTYNQNK